MHLVGKDENVSAVVASGAIVPLLDNLALPRDRPVMEAIQERRKLLEATTRALKAIFASSRTIKYDTFTVGFFHTFCLVFCTKNPSPLLCIEKTYSRFSFDIRCNIYFSLT